MLLMALSLGREGGSSREVEEDRLIAAAPLEMCLAV